jgi:hypothetical protein
MESRVVLVAGGQPIAFIDLQDSFETADCGWEVAAPFIGLGEDAKHGCFTGLVSQLDEVLRGIVQASFGLKPLSHV